jgi:Tripartite tricarboxylate transporter TctB family
MKIRAHSDFWSGLLFVAIGLAVVVLARNYRMGTAARMGPGYFPTLLGWLMALIGLTLSLPAFVVEGENVQRVHPRPLLFVLLAVAAFGITLSYLGFAAAIVALVVVASFAEPDLRPLETAGIAAFLVVFCILIFVVLLGLPIRLWPEA